MLLAGRARVYTRSAPPDGAGRLGGSAGPDQQLCFAVVRGETVYGRLGASSVAGAAASIKDASRRRGRSPLAILDPARRARGGRLRPGRRNGASTELRNAGWAMRKAGYRSSSGRREPLRSGS